MLRDEDLNRLEAVWRAQGAPISDDLAPGLTETEIDSRIPADLPLSAEARRWWGWHDGTRGGIWSASSATGVGMWNLMSLAEALQWRADMMAQNDPPEFPDDPGDWEGQWAGWWLPIVHYDGATLFLDLSAATPDGDTPVHLWSKIPDEIFDVQFASLGDLVGGWLAAFEGGYFRFSAETGKWVAPDVLPDDVRVLI